MYRFYTLSAYQKGLLVVMAMMVIVFAVVYPITISQVGLRYQDEILVPHFENGDTVYSGKINGKQTVLTVSADKTVVLHYEDQVYGPYTAVEDPSAIPTNHTQYQSMTGVELREGDEILFRGGVIKSGDSLLLFDAEGLADTQVSIVIAGGTRTDPNGNPIDPIKPSAAKILSWMDEPELTHKGIGGFWFLGVFLCLLNTLSILFADELFHMRLAFRIRDAYDAEPSDWELTGRYISWVLVILVAFNIFMVGLQ